MVISGRRRGGDARTHNLPLTGIYKGYLRRFWRTHGFINLKTFVRTQNFAFVPTYTFRMKSTESFINETPDLSPIENIWCIIKLKMRQRGPRTLEQLETYIRQKWDQIPTPKLQKLITSMPRRLQTVLKRRGDATPW